jgi:hypothetical protein
MKKYWNKIRDFDTQRQVLCLTGIANLNSINFFVFFYLTFTLLACKNTAYVSVFLHSSHLGSNNYKIINGNKLLFDTTIYSQNCYNKRNEVFDKKLKINFIKKICFIHNDSVTVIEKCAKLKRKKGIFIDITPTRIKIESADKRVFY